MMPALEIIEVTDSELHRDDESDPVKIYQGDLFRGFIIKGKVRDDALKVTSYLVYVIYPLKRK